MVNIWLMMVEDGYDIYDIPSGKLQCEAPKIANLVHITPITMVYGTYITYNHSYWGESKPTYNWGGLKL